MSMLTLVRHGQASFFADDYDRLSAIGQAQARLLGEFWGRLGRPIDVVYTGPRLRQRQTAELAGAAFERAEFEWPAPIVLLELDEYDLGGLLQHLAPALERREPRFADLCTSYRGSCGEVDKARSFQRMFERLTLHWQEASEACEELEAWPAFSARVGRGIGRMIEPSGHGRRVVAFTSGGFIGTAVQRTLGAPDRAALELSWRLRNSSLTEFVFGRGYGRCTLDSFNTLPHLEDSALWTYR